ncbi:hypothetical protein [Rhodococcus sp. HNM0569]|uniref:hypothetical protein n=1 Tax=Rhodococcus sp. HNM0569 TaxID=2716340 RepID=UPI00146C0582|nr:hypothetical protein [Rhodococcus sp. HNM0569]NLU83948.1 hypothetical protein [Rhodococcus sp. HNM0569]
MSRADARGVRMLVTLGLRTDGTPTALWALAVAIGAGAIGAAAPAQRDGLGLVLVLAGAIAVLCSSVVVRQSETTGFARAAGCGRCASELAGLTLAAGAAAVSAALAWLSLVVVGTSVADATAAAGPAALWGGALTGITALAVQFTDTSTGARALALVVVAAACLATTVAGVAPGGARGSLVALALGVASGIVACAAATRRDLAAGVPGALRGLGSVPDAIRARLVQLPSAPRWHGGLPLTWIAGTVLWSVAVARVGDEPQWVVLPAAVYVVAAIGALRRDEARGATLVPLAPVVRVRWFAEQLVWAAAAALVLVAVGGAVERVSANETAGLAGDLAATVPALFAVLALAAALYGATGRGLAVAWVWLGYTAIHALFDDALPRWTGALSPLQAPVPVTLAVAVVLAAAGVAGFRRRDLGRRSGGVRAWSVARESDEPEFGVVGEQTVAR